MRRMKQTIATAVAVAAALALLALPASATPGADVLTGTATVSPGLGLPVLNDKAANWSFSTVGLLGNSVSAAGTLFGACGLSSGTGTGTYVDANGNSHSLAVGWVTSAGTVLPVAGTYSGHGSGQILAPTRATAQDAVNQCVAGTAGAFDVQTVAVLVGD